jgi:hypothetical protein
MKTKRISILFIMALSCCATYVNAQIFMRISTDRTDLIYEVDNTGRIYQTYLSEKLMADSEYKNLSDYITDTNNNIIKN